MQEILNDDTFSEEEKRELISDMLKSETEVSKFRTVRTESKKKQDRSHEQHCESLHHKYSTSKMYYRPQREIDRYLRGDK